MAHLGGSELEETAAVLEQQNTLPQWRHYEQLWCPLPQYTASCLLDLHLLHLRGTDPVISSISTTMWRNQSLPLSGMSYRRGSVAVRYHQQWYEFHSPAAMLRAALHQAHHQSVPHTGCSHLCKYRHLHMASLNALYKTHQIHYTTCPLHFQHIAKKVTVYFLHRLPHSKYHQIVQFL